MYLLSFCQLLGKSFAMAILVQIGGKTLAVSVLGGEMVAFLVYKLVRGDFRYWVPLPRGASLVLSLIERVIVKVICDFTGFLHSRHPYEMGGFYWLMNMVFTQASVFGAIKLKEEFGGQVEGAGREQWRAVKEEDYTMIATVLLLTWLVALLGLMFGSEKEFMNTFYSLRTAKQYNEALFRSGEDEIMIQALDDHPSYYAHFEDEIKEWLGRNWNDWHASRPGWLTEAVMNNIPLRLLPGEKEIGVLDEFEAGGGGGGEGEGEWVGVGRRRVTSTRETLSKAFFESIRLTNIIYQKCQLFLMNRWFNVINTLHRATGTAPRRWLVHPRSRSLYAHVEEGDGLWRSGWGLARLLVLLPRCFLAGGGAVERAQPCRTSGA